MDFVLGLQNAGLEQTRGEEGDSLSSVLSTNCCNTKAEEEA